MLQSEIVRPRLLVTLMLAVFLGACQRPLPPLVRGARSVGATSYDCEQDVVPRSNATFARSPQINERLSKYFPTGSQSKLLRNSLVRQGFQLQGRCSADHSISWARFRRGGDRIVKVYWREDKKGRLLWTFGNVRFGFTQAARRRTAGGVGVRITDFLASLVNR